MFVHEANPRGTNLTDVLPTKWAPTYFSNILNEYTLLYAEQLVH